MSEPAFTPGPWELWDGCSWRRFGSVSTGKVVVEPIVYSELDRHPDLRVSKEDARLIAAAPALYVACKRALKCMKNCPVCDTVVEDVIAAALALSQRRTQR